MNNELIPLSTWASYQIHKLRMYRECREYVPHPRRVSDPDMHHGACVTHVPWCMPGSLTSGGGGGENVPGICNACATRNFAYQVRGSLRPEQSRKQFADDIFKCIFPKNNSSISGQTSLILGANGSIDNTVVCFSSVITPQNSQKVTFLAAILISFETFNHDVYANIKAPCHWPLRGESTGVRSTPFTKGQ